MGLTLNCARCHSHKYDPIPQRDYYRFVALFRGAYDEYEWLTPQPFNNQWKDAGRRFLTVVLPSERREIEEHNAPIREEIATLREELNGEDVSGDRKKELQNEIAGLQSQLRDLPLIRALWDRGAPSPTYIYQRGDETRPTHPVDAGVPSALTGEWASFEVTAPDHSTPKTGRRLALARWLTDPNHPLTARVFVNRIWHQLFGRASSRASTTSDNWARSPTHPELLDWLAVEFVESGWSVKHLQRLILTSTAWRQSSTVSRDQMAADPGKRPLFTDVAAAALGRGTEGHPAAGVRSSRRTSVRSPPTRLKSATTASSRPPRPMPVGGGASTSDNAGRRCRRCWKPSTCHR